MNGTATSRLRYTDSVGDAGVAGAIAAALLTASPAAGAQMPVTPVRAQHSIKPSILQHKAQGWVEVQLGRIEGLQVDWDGYGADPISPKVVSSMRALLREMTTTLQPGSIVPGADGSLQAEWHVERASFGLLVDDSGAVSCWVRPAGAPEIEKFDFEARELFGIAVNSYLA